MMKLARCILTVLCVVAWASAADPPLKKEQAKERLCLADGIYPVAPTEEPPPDQDLAIEIVELANVPVSDDDVPVAAKIRIINRPLLRFRNLTHFDFKFEKDECREVGFQNTKELKAYTRDHVGSRLAVVISNRVITHHKIREPLESARVRITCCTVGGGDHLHKHLTRLKLSADVNRQSQGAD